MIKVKAQNIMLLLAMIQSAGSFSSYQTILNKEGTKVDYAYLHSIISLTSFFMSTPNNVEKALDEQILHFGLGSKPQYLDPHLANSVSAHNVIIALIEGLVSGTLKPLNPCRELLKNGISQMMGWFTFHLGKMPVEQWRSRLLMISFFLSSDFEPAFTQVCFMI